MRDGVDVAHAADAVHHRARVDVHQTVVGVVVERQAGVHVGQHVERVGYLVPDLRHAVRAEHRHPRRLVVHGHRQLQAGPPAVVPAYQHADQGFFSGGGRLPRPTLPQRRLHTRTVAAVSGLGKMWAALLVAAAAPVRQSDGVRPWSITTAAKRS